MHVCLSIVSEFLCEFLSSPLHVALFVGMLCLHTSGSLAPHTLASICGCLEGLREAEGPTFNFSCVK